MVELGHLLEQRNHEAAVRAHEQTTAAIGENFKVVLSSAGAAVRVLLTINAGGVIALLGFIGAIAGKEKKIFASADIFIPPMTSFGIGVMLAAAATGLIYFAQMAFGAAQSMRRFDFDHPYVHVTPRSTKARRIGYVLQFVTISIAIGSFIAFAIGLWLSKTIVVGAQL
ncbi:hypothetical protein ABIE88_000578 [Bradyrhizobium diazoefficiens]|uniref:hypothetical protein n=1 Tax=Bradyrhizobium diazoefficiens TaxID=1355477 RepID=UPI00351350E7